MADQQAMKVPAPGTYDLNAKTGEGSKYTMGARNSTSSIIQKNDNPGPGQYKPVNVTH